MGAGRPGNLGGVVSGVTLDAGALIAFEAGDGRMRALVRLTNERKLPVIVPAGVLAQVWRGSARQAPLAALLKAPHVTVPVLDEQLAKAVGTLCGRRGTRDVVDASVVLAARLTRTIVITTDPDDIALLDPHLPMRSL